MQLIQDQTLEILEGDKVVGSYSMRISRVPADAGKDFFHVTTHFNSQVGGDKTEETHEGVVSENMGTVYAKYSRTESVSDRRPSLMFFDLWIRRFIFPLVLPTGQYFTVFVLLFRVFLCRMREWRRSESTNMSIRPTECARCLFSTRITVKLAAGSTFIQKTRSKDSSVRLPMSSWRVFLPWRNTSRITLRFCHSMTSDISRKWPMSVSTSCRLIKFDSRFEMYWIEKDENLLLQKNLLPRKTFIFRPYKIDCFGLSREVPPAAVQAYIKVEEHFLNRRQVDHSFVKSSPLLFLQYTYEYKSTRCLLQVD